MMAAMMAPAPLQRVSARAAHPQRDFGRAMMAAIRRAMMEGYDDGRAMMAATID